MLILIYVSFLLILFVVAVDQLTKHAALTLIGIGGQPAVIVDGFFYITCHRNTGAAWGLFKDGRVFFIILTTVALIVMLYFLFREGDVFFRIALSFVIGGAVGNYIDRIAVGGVVDFLDFYIFGYNFPTFNAADSSIVFGAALLIIWFFRSGRLKNKT